MTSSIKIRDRPEEPLMNDNHVSLPGSFREPLAAAQVLGPVAASTPIEVTLVLRRRAELPAEPAPGGIDSADLAAQFGADPADVDLVTRTVTEAGAKVIQSDPASRRVRISGTVGTLQALFGTTLQLARVTDPDGRSLDVRHRTGDLSVPAALAGVVTAVLGLDDRPQARAQLRVAAAAAAGTSYTPLDLAKFYRMPAGTPMRLRSTITERHSPGRKGRSYRSTTPASGWFASRAQRPFRVVGDQVPPRPRLTLRRGADRG